MTSSALWSWRSIDLTACAAGLGRRACPASPARHRAARNSLAAQERITRDSKPNEPSTTGRRALVLQSRRESIDQAESIAEDVARKAGFDEQDLYKITMAVREITMNAIAHGNAWNNTKTVNIEFMISRDDLTVQIADEGTGFNSNNLPDPLAPENLLRQSGRGIFIARAFMDHVDVESDARGTRVRMVKRRAKPE